MLDFLPVERSFLIDSLLVVNALFLIWALRQLATISKLKRLLRHSFKMNEAMFEGLRIITLGKKSGNPALEARTTLFGVGKVAEGYNKGEREKENVVG